MSTTHTFLELPPLPFAFGLRLWIWLGLARFFLVRDPFDAKFATVFYNL